VKKYDDAGASTVEQSEQTRGGSVVASAEPAMLQPESGQDDAGSSLKRMGARHKDESGLEDKGNAAGETDEDARVLNEARAAYDAHMAAELDGNYGRTETTDGNYGRSLPRSSTVSGWISSSCKIQHAMQTELTSTPGEQLAPSKPW
jgi:hypothetical protein